MVSTCVELFSSDWLSGACVCAADHTDGICLPAAQLVEGAVGAAGVADGGYSSAVHR